MKKMFEKNKNFITYSYVGLFITFLNIILLWIFIDLLNIPTILSSTIIVGGLFILKFYILNIICIKVN